MADESSPSSIGTPSWGTFPGMVVERWVVQYELKKKTVLGTGPVLKRIIGLKGLGLGEAKKWSTYGVGEAKNIGSRSGLALPRASKGCLRGPPCQLPIHAIEIPAVYKRTLIMLRSLYCRLRLLPAYHLFRLANSSSHSDSFTLSYRVLPSPPPLAEIDEMDMTMYNFMPVETLHGQICLSVAYRHTTAITALEVSPPILPQIISDYVGSPTTDLLKRFPADLHPLPYGGISGRRGVHVVSLPSSVTSSPSRSSFARHRSWNGVNKMQLTLQPQSSPLFGISKSTSPSYPYEINPSPLNPPSSCPPCFSSCITSDHSPSLRSSPSHTSLDHPCAIQEPNVKQNDDSLQPNTDGHWSLPFSPSTLPSPSTSYSHDGKAYIGPLRSGSAPVSIPKPSLSHSPRPRTMNVHQQSESPLFPPPSPKNRIFETLPRAFSANETPLIGKVTPRFSTSSESLGQIAMLPNFQQVQRSETIAASSFFGFGKLPCRPLHTSMSRGSSKDGGLDAQDEDFTCPFAVDEDGVEEQRCRVESPRSRGEASEPSDSTGRGKMAHQRSLDVAVGALVRMLKSAPPLRNPVDSLGATLDMPSNSLEVLRSQLIRGNPVNLQISTSSGKLDTASVQTCSGASTSYSVKTTADALEELSDYKYMRDLLLSQSEEKVIGRPAR